MNYDFLWREDVPMDEMIEGYQDLIDTGMAWKLEGSVGRNAMNLIEQGYCTLGPVGHKDYYGNYIPSRFEVEPGTKGSQEFVDARTKLRG